MAKRNKAKQSQAKKLAKLAKPVRVTVFFNQRQQQLKKKYKRNVKVVINTNCVLGDIVIKKINK